MSSSSIKPPTSPRAQWLSNDDRVTDSDKTEQDAGHVAIAAPRRSEASDVVGGDSQGASKPITSYPFDENIFDTAPTQRADGDGTDEKLQYEEPAAEDPTHPLDFGPFFTLIEDPETGEHQHPTVNYIFSDDDPEILTTALLDTLDRTEDTTHSKQRPDEVRERYVIIDIAADGKSVASASSMSPDWQALKTSIAQAPSWGENNNGTDRGLMLKISGWQNSKYGAAKDGKRRQEPVGDIDELIKTYNERLERLNDVLGNQ